MRYEGRDLVLSGMRLRELRPDVNEIGAEILSFLRDAPAGCDLDALVDHLLSQYDADRETIRVDAVPFVEECIREGILTEVDGLRVYGLDLSITNRCNARCVYCPTARLQPEGRLLSLAAVDKLIDDLSAPRFREAFGALSTLEVGGLAEPLLHPGALDILRLFRRRYPTPFVTLYTNAALLDGDTASSLIGERLINLLVVSIDGLDDREHRASKRIPYSIVESNLDRFLGERDRRDGACRVWVNVLTYPRYRSLVRRHLLREPLNAPEPDLTLEDHTQEIMERWRRRLRAGDEVRDAANHFQLRGEDSPEEAAPASGRHLPCPWFDYVAHSVSVTCDGDVVICCNDFRRENVLGNYLRTNLYDVVAGARRNFLRTLARDDQEALPSRCRRRAYCQNLSAGVQGEQR